MCSNPNKNVNPQTTSEAELLHREALSGREKTLGFNNPTTWESLDALAALLVAGNRPKEAEPLQRAALKARNSVPRKDGPPDRAEIQAMSTLAQALKMQGRSSEAVVHFRIIYKHCHEALELGVFSVFM